MNDYFTSNNKVFRVTTIVPETNVSGVEVDIENNGTQSTEEHFYWKDVYFFQDMEAAINSLCTVDVFTIKENIKIKIQKYKILGMIYGDRVDKLDPQLKDDMIYVSSIDYIPTNVSLHENLYLMITDTHILELRSSRLSGVSIGTTLTMISTNKGDIICSSEKMICVEVLSMNNKYNKVDDNE